MNLNFTRLDHDIVQVDLQYAGIPKFCAGYIMAGPTPVIIETGAKPCIPYLLAAFKELNINPLDVQYVIVSHIHLDHAAGAGTLLQHCPNAVLVVHEKGARHMVNPSRLLAGAKAAYGEELYNKIAGFDPVSPDRIHTPKDNEILDLGQGRTLTLLDTPGHCMHHLSIYDNHSHGIFCGDAAGLYFSDLAATGMPYYIPGTSPNQFNLDLSLSTLERLARLQPKFLYYTHFGAAPDAANLLRKLPQQLIDYVAIAKEVYQTSQDWEAIRNALWHYHQQDLATKGIHWDTPQEPLFKDTLELSAKGLTHYLSKAV